MVAAATTATAMIYKFTYTLGRSLYVPLTSKCNSISLPQTRGTGFLLPKNVAIPLIYVRDAEDPGCVQSDIYNNYEESDEPESLPTYNFPLVNTIYHQFSNNDISKHLQEQREIITAAAQGTKENGYNSQVDDDMLQPSIATLINEVSTRLESAGNMNKFDQVVLAGEGESTLRMDALLAVARCVKAFRGKEVQDSSSSSSSSSTADNKPTRQSSDRRFVLPDKLPVRVITNGLSYGNVNFGYSPYNTKRNGVITPMHRHVILRDMMEAGISRLSVALNTANRHEYDLLMEPCCYTGGGLIQHGGVDSSSEDTVIDQPSLLPGTAHDLVCEFILEAVKLGMDVEITGIDRPGIDKVETERLARLLLSVGPDKFKRRRMVRWRRYFD